MQVSIIKFGFDVKWAKDALSRGRIDLDTKGAGQVFNKRSRKP